MAQRNFLQQGAAYGSTGASVVVTIDGQQIFAGPVPTINAPLPVQPGSDIDDTLCQWTLPADFNGAALFTLTVSGSPVVIADSLADRQGMTDVSVLQPLDYTQTIDGITVTDPFTNVTIDGQSQTRSSTLTGQWYWLVNPGQTFTADLNIVADIIYPDWVSDQSYAPNSAVVHANACWTNGPTPAPAGLEPGTDYMTWFVIPVPVWANTKSFAVNDYVHTLNDNNLWMATQNVPTGIAITDTSYWTLRFPSAGVPGVLS